MSKADANGTIVVLGVTADIGREVSLRFIRDGWNVVGLGRSPERLKALSNELGIATVPCNLSDREATKAAIAEVLSSGLTWDCFLSCAGTMEPIGSFFSLDFDTWEASITANLSAQLRVLHGIWPARRPNRIVDAVLLAGGGTNGPFRNYSAYCLSKIALIKACELLDDEEPEINAVAIGPGYVRTRIHEETLRAGHAAGANFQKTLDFFSTPGTSFDDIYAHIRWCMANGRPVAGGRNFSTVHDGWRDTGEALANLIRGDAGAYKLRRCQPGPPL